LAGVPAVDDGLVFCARPEVDAVVFGRRWLGLAVEVDLLLPDVALGRVVRNAPRTSSSCWAKASTGRKPTSAIKTLKNRIFVLMAKLLLRPKYEARITMGFMYAGA
jgi:hypothetical protein